MSLCFFLLLSAGFFTATVFKLLAPEKALFAPEGGEGFLNGFLKERVWLEDEAQLAERLKVPLDSRLAATRDRLMRVKGLLPTAAKLANAADSAEAQKLFEMVQGTVSRGLLAAQLGRDTTRLEPCLTTALMALQRLHAVAREKAAKLLIGDRFLQALPELGLWESDVVMAASDLQGDVVRQTVEPFLKTIRSLQQNSETLYKRVGTVGTWLRTRREFEDEGDEETLLTAAVNLEYLYNTSEARRHLFKIAEQVHKSTVDAAKALMMAERDDVVWQINEQLNVLRMQTVMEMNKTKRDDALVQDGSYNVRAKQTRLEALQHQMDLVLLLSAQLRAEGRALQASSTLQAVVIHNANAKKVEERAVPLLKDCVTEAEALCKPAHELQSSAKHLLPEAGQ